MVFDVLPDHRAAELRQENPVPAKGQFQSGEGHVCTKQVLRTQPSEIYDI